MIKTIAIASLLVMGCQKVDPLFCASHLSDPRCGPSDAGIDDAPTDAPPGFFTIGGTVLGNLTGAGLVLENNGGNDLMITAAGTFQFSVPVEMGMPYAVTASSQPNNPSQICTVTNSSGNAIADVADITVSCETNSYMVSGSVFGLNTGQNVTLLLNGGHDLPIAGAGTMAVPVSQPFMFTSTIDSGDTFLVSIGTPPAAQTCAVTGGNGTMGSGNVSGVNVNCATNFYTISGEVSDLVGKVTLSDGTNQITPSSNGSFSFPPLAANTVFTVTVVTQPTPPSSPLAQTCVVGNGGPPPLTLTANVLNVTVMCTTNTYTIGGSVVAGLSGTLVLADNGSDLKTLTTNSAFTFGVPVASGSTYGVTVHSQPANEECTVSTGAGTVVAANVTNVSVACDPGIACGAGGTCDPTQDVCCVGAHTCSNGGCMGNLGIPCDSTSDCTLAGTPGTCCATEMSGAVKSVTCTTSCAGFELCDPNVVDACPNGKTCQAYGHLPGYFDCQ